MNTARRAVPILLALIAVIAVALCHPAPKATAQQAPTAALNSQIVPTPTPTGEEIALRAQLDEMRRSEDRLLQVVVAGLGIIAVVNIVGYALVGRSFDHGKGAMLQELRGVLTQEASSTRAELTAMINDAVAKQDQRIEARQKSFSELAKLDQELALSSVKQQQEFMATQREADLKEVNTWIQRYADLSSTGHRNLRFELNELKAEYYHAIASYGEHQAAIELLQDSEQMGGGYYTTTALNVLIRALQRDTYISISELPRITSMLDKLPRKHSVLVESVRELLRESQRKKHQANGSSG